MRGTGSDVCAFPPIVAGQQQAIASAPAAIRSPQCSNRTGSSRIDQRTRRQRWVCSFALRQCWFADRVCTVSALRGTGVQSKRLYLCGCAPKFQVCNHLEFVARRRGSRLCRQVPQPRGCGFEGAGFEHCNGDSVMTRLNGWRCNGTPFARPRVKK